MRVIAGKVVDAKGNPIAGIAVLLDERLSAETGSGGWYLFANASAGRHSVRVLWEEHNAKHGTKYLFDHPVVEVVVNEACGAYHPPVLVDP